MSNFIGVLFILGSSQLNDSSTFDLKGPYIWSQPNQIQKWAVQGLTNLRNSLKLVQDSSRNQSYLCNLVMYSGDSYELELDFSVTAGIFHFLFANEFCPLKSADISKLTSDGVHLYAYKNGFNKLSLNAIISNRFSMISNTTLCEIEGSEARIKISKQPHLIEFYYYSKSDNKLNKCGEQIEGTFYKNGYFSAFGSPYNKEGGNQILNSFSATPINISQNVTDSYSKINSKILKAIVGSNYQKKHELIYASKVETEDELTEQGNKVNPETTKLIFQILSEITERSKFGVSETEFSNIIQVSALYKLIRAEYKMSKRKSVLGEISKNVKKLKKLMANNLTNLTTLAQEQMKEVEEKGFDTLKKFMTSLWKGNAVVDLSLRKKKKAKMNPVTLWLLTICFIEAVLYLIFFLVRRHQTKNFRKID